LVDLQYADNSPQKPVRFREEVNRKYNANFYFCEIPLDKDGEEQLKELKKHQDGRAPHQDQGLGREGGKGEGAGGGGNGITGCRQEVADDEPTP